MISQQFARRHRSQGSVWTVHHEPDVPAEVLVSQILPSPLSGARGRIGSRNGVGSGRRPHGRSRAGRSPRYLCSVAWPVYPAIYSTSAETGW